MKHSWFIRFTYQFEKSNWFLLTFWKKYRQIKEILPEIIFKLVRKESDLLQLFEMFGIPWILRWDWGKTTQLYPEFYLDRCISVKWWDKFDTSPILQKRTIPKMVKQSQVMTSQSQRFTQLNQEKLVILRHLYHR